MLIEVTVSMVDLLSRHTSMPNLLEYISTMSSIEVNILQIRPLQESTRSSWPKTIGVYHHHYLNNELSAFGTSDPHTLIKIQPNQTTNHYSKLYTPKVFPIALFSTKKHVHFQKSVKPCIGVHTRMLQDHTLFTHSCRNIPRSIVTFEVLSDLPAAVLGFDYK